MTQYEGGVFKTAMSEGFSEQWRRVHSCSSCRSHKVRCEYLTPDSEKCKRCERLGSSCTMYVPARKRAAVDDTIKTAKTTKTPKTTAGHDNKRAFTRDKGAKGTKAQLSSFSKGLHTATSEGIRALAEAEDIPAQSRLNQLYDLIETAKASVDLINTSCGMTKEDMGSRRDDDWVQQAIDKDLYSEEEAKHCYNFFFEDMCHMVVVRLDYLDYEVARMTKPMLCLTIVTASAIAMTLDKMELRTNFFERILGDHIIVKQIVSIELAQAMMLNSYFISSGNGFIMFQLASNISTTMDLGLIDDQENFEKLCCKELSPEEDARCMEGIELFTSTTISFLFIALNSLKPRFTDLVLRRVEGLVKLRNSRELSIMHRSCIEYIILAVRTLEIIDNFKKTTSPDEIFDICFAGLDEITASREKILQGIPYDDTTKVEEGFFSTMLQQLCVSLTESATYHIVSCIGVNHGYVWRCPKLAELCMHTRKYALLMRDYFFGCSQRLKSFPRYCFFRPMRATVLMVQLVKLQTKILEFSNGGKQLIEAYPSWKPFLTTPLREELYSLVVRTDELWCSLAKFNRMASENYHYFDTLKQWYQAEMNSLFSAKDASAQKTPDGTDRYLMDRATFPVSILDPTKKTSMGDSGYLRESSTAKLERSRKKSVMWLSDYSDQNQKRSRLLPVPDALLCPFDAYNVSTEKGANEQDAKEQDEQLRDSTRTDDPGSTDASTLVSHSDIDTNICDWDNLGSIDLLSTDFFSQLGEDFFQGL